MALLRGDAWVASDAGTGHHDMIVGSCRSLGGYEPDVRHRSSDADVQLELVRTTGAVALLPALTLPTADPALAIRDVAEQQLRRRLVVVTRDAPSTPALTAFLAVLNEQARTLRRSPVSPSTQTEPPGLLDRQPTASVLS